MSEPYEASDDPGWDFMRANSWDLYDGEGRPLTDLTELLVLIGAGTLPPDQQRAMLARWTRSAAYVPAPAELKAAIAEYLGGGEDGGDQPAS